MRKGIDSEERHRKDGKGSRHGNCFAACVRHVASSGRRGFASGVEPWSPTKHRLKILKADNAFPLSPPKLSCHCTSLHVCRQNDPSFQCQCAVFTHAPKALNPFLYKVRLLPDTQSRMVCAGAFPNPQYTRPKHKGCSSLRLMSFRRGSCARASNSRQARAFSAASVGNSRSGRNIFTSADLEATSEDMW